MSLQHGRAAWQCLIAIWAACLYTVTSCPMSACMQVTAYIRSPELTGRLHLTDQSDDWQSKSSRPHIPVLLSTAQCNSDSWLQAFVLRPAKPATA